MSILSKNNKTYSTVTTDFGVVAAKGDVTDEELAAIRKAINHIYATKTRKAPASVRARAGREECADMWRDYAFRLGLNPPKPSTWRFSMFS